MSEYQTQQPQPTQPQPQYVVALKSTGTAYLLWFFLGAFGAHQFYLGKTGRAVSMLLTLGWLTVGLWVDMFTLGKQTRKVNASLGYHGPAV